MHDPFHLRPSPSLERLRLSVADINILFIIFYDDIIAWITDAICGCAESAPGVDELVNSKEIRQDSTWPMSVSLRIGFYIIR